MEEYGDRIQSLMDEVYDEWRKEENKGKGKWDVLAGFSEAHQIAVAFGNFNYQVGNGGISQWIYNGYFEDDAEKLTGYLEIGAESDERCCSGNLNQYAKRANETGSIYAADVADLRVRLDDVMAGVRGIVAGLSGIK
jgi:hypothetical protein